MPAGADFTADDTIAQAFKDKPLRPMWQTLKEHQIASLKRQLGPGDKNIERIFTRGLGPSLDDLDKECAKYPSHNWARIQQLINQISGIIGTYKAEVRSVRLGLLGVPLITFLDGIEKEVERRADFYNVTMKRPS